MGLFVTTCKTLLYLPMCSGVQLTSAGSGIHDPLSWHCDVIHSVGVWPSSQWYLTFAPS